MADAGPPVRAPDEDRGPIMTTALWVFTGTSILLQIARLWSRLRIKKLGWDDYWMFFTTGLLAAFSVAVQITMNHGGGRHLYYLMDEGMDKVLHVAKLSWISQPFCIMAVGTGKIAVGLMILRFLYASQKWLRWSLWFCMISVNLSLAIAIFLTFFQCNPPRKLWTPQLKGECWPPSLQINCSLFAASYSAFADVYLAICPLTILWKLQMKMEKKIGLCIIFGLGVLAGACGFYKTSKIPGVATHGDITWESYEALLYTGAEIWLIIICGTVPTIVPLWDAIFGRKRQGPSRYALSNYKLSGSHKLSSSSKVEDNTETHPLPQSAAAHGTAKGIAVHHTVDVEFASNHSKNSIV